MKKQLLFPIVEIYLLFKMIRSLLIFLLFGTISISANTGDLEISMLVYEESWEKVLDYFQNNLQNDTDLFKNNEVKISFTRQKIETLYFDTPALNCLEKKNGITYNIYTSKLKPQEIAEEIEVYQQGNGIQPSIFSVKHYNRISMKEEKHPLIKLIKRSEREQFYSILKKMGITKPMALRVLMPVAKKRLTIEIEGQNQFPITVVLESLKSSMYFVSINLVVLKLYCKNQSSNTAGSLKNENSKMMFNNIREHLLKKFPSVKQIDNCDYVNIMNTFKDNFLPFIFISKFPVVFKLVQVLFYSCIGFLLFIIFFRKRIFSAK